MIDSENGQAQSAKVNPTQKQFALNRAVLKSKFPSVKIQFPISRQIVIAIYMLCCSLSSFQAWAKDCKPDVSGTDKITKQQNDIWVQNVFVTSFGSGLMSETAKVSIFVTVGRYGNSSAVNVEILKEEESQQSAAFESSLRAVKGNRFLLGFKDGLPLSFVATAVANSTKVRNDVLDFGKGKLVTTVILSAVMPDETMATLRDAVTKKPVDAVRVFLAGDVILEKSVKDGDGRKLMDKFSCFYNLLDERGIGLATAGSKNQSQQSALVSNGLPSQDYAASAPGKYVRKGKSNDFLELRSDGTFYLWQEGKGFGGTYQIAGDVGIMQISNGPVSKGRFGGNTLTDPNGTVWEKQAKPQGSVAVAVQRTPISNASKVATLPVAPGTVVAWGDNRDGQATVPVGLSGVTAIAAGWDHTVALKGDGTVVAWGKNISGQTTPPVGLSEVMAIAAGMRNTLALKSDGTVVAWGGNAFGETGIPSGLSGVTAIAAGQDHTVALKSNGTVVAWGDNGFGQTTVPADLSGVTAIAAGRDHTVALKSDGTVVAWGDNRYGQTTVPTGLSGVTAIAAGQNYTVALRSDGTVVAWGDNSRDDRATVPAGLNGVTAIAAGGAHTVALKSDGVVVAWGWNGDGQTTVPAGLNGVTAIAAGGAHTVALKSYGPRLATATAQVVGGFVVGINITDGGSGYTDNPAVTISGDGSGSKAAATMVDGVVTSIKITSPGSGYTSATITIAPPRFPPRKAIATAQVVNGFVVGINITDGGFGYDNSSAVILSGGGGSGAEAIATVVNGVVTRIVITNPGSGYTAAPTVGIALLSQKEGAQSKAPEIPALADIEVNGARFLGVWQSDAYGMTIVKDGDVFIVEVMRTSGFEGLQGKYVAKLEKGTLHFDLPILGEARLSSDGKTIYWHGSEWSKRAGDEWRRK
jgi:hypothetical protein